MNSITKFSVTLIPVQVDLFLSILNTLVKKKTAIMKSNIEVLNHSKRAIILRTKYF